MGNWAWKRDIVPSFIKITLTIYVGGITAAMMIIFLHDNVIYFAVDVGPLFNTEKVELDDVE